MNNVTLNFRLLLFFGRAQYAEPAEISRHTNAAPRTLGLKINTQKLEETICVINSTRQPVCAWVKMYST